MVGPKREVFALTEQTKMSAVFGATIREHSEPHGPSGTHPEGPLRLGFQQGIPYDLK